MQKCPQKTETPHMTSPMMCTGSNWRDSETDRHRDGETGKSREERRGEERELGVGGGRGGRDAGEAGEADETASVGAWAAGHCFAAAYRGGQLRAGRGRVYLH